VVQGSVDQNTTIIPSSGLDPNGLVDESTLDKRLVGDSDGCQSASLSFSLMT
jgi:hypothetical protein